MLKGGLVLVAAGLGALVLLPVAVVTTLTSQTTTGGLPTDTAQDDIPPALLDTYQRAVVDRCPTLPWSVVAGIGKIESDHGRTGGATVRADGTVAPPILGPALDGSPGVARIVDTDGGRFDLDTRFDRAVGPMQFIPSTWAATGVDGDGDGVADPHDVDDAVPTTVAYLCDAGGDDPARLRQAVWTYNHSWDYVDDVLAWSARYATLAPSGRGDPTLVAAVLDDPRLTIYAAGRDDVAAGRIDDRVLAVLLQASQRWPLAVSSLQTGHSMCIGGGAYAGCSVSNHWHGRAVDVYRVGAAAVTAANGEAYAMARWLDGLGAGLRPDETGSPWPALEGLPGHFSDSAHRDHLHIGYEAGAG